MADNIKTNKAEIFQKTPVIAGLALICTFLWGSASPCIKLGYQFFQIPSDSMWSQMLFAGIRFVIAGLMVIVVQSILTKQVIKPKKTSWPSILKLCLFQTVLQYIFFYGGLAHASGVKCSIINGSNTFFAILVTTLVFKQEKLTSRKILGCVLGFSGVVLVNITGGSFDLNVSFMGEGFILLCAIAYAVSSSLIKIYSEKDSPVMLSGYQFAVGGVILVLLGLVGGGSIPHVDGKALLMLFYLACISAVSYTLWGILIKYNSVSRVAIFGFANPVFGVILSAWWLGEASSFGWEVVVALLLVCAGIFVVNKGTNK